MTLTLSDVPLIQVTKLFNYDDQGIKDLLDALDMTYIIYNMQTVLNLQKSLESVILDSDEK